MVVNNTYIAPSDERSLQAQNQSDDNSQSISEGDHVVNNISIEIASVRREAALRFEQHRRLAASPEPTIQQASPTPAEPIVHLAASPEPTTQQATNTTAVIVHLAASPEPTDVPTRPPMAVATTRYQTLLDSKCPCCLVPWLEIPLRDMRMLPCGHPICARCAAGIASHNQYDEESLLMWTYPQSFQLCPVCRKRYTPANVIKCYF